MSNSLSISATYVARVVIFMVALAMVASLLVISGSGILHQIKLVQ